MTDEIKKVMCVVGTRPEAIKMAPLILSLKKEPWAKTTVLATAQHREMLDQVLTFFDIAPDYDLDIMQPNQDLTELTARLLVGAGNVLDEEAPDILLVQGDTTTVLALALAAFYRGIKVGHVEAGLRTGDMLYPFPEEANRVLTSRLAQWHFAPTESARSNLLAEGIASDSILVTGNTVIDALLKTVSLSPSPSIPLPEDRRIVLVTCHRRENFGKPFRNICSALKKLADLYPDIHIVFPIHPNPNIKTAAAELLGGIENIQLCSPFEYPGFVAIMQRAHLIISDSGGVQEEAPALGKPVLVLRNETERPEAVREGVVKLVGTSQETLVYQASRLLTDDDYYSRMAVGRSPYGDGKAANRIIKVLRSGSIDYLED